MSLNQVIALGGTQNKSPAERFLETKSQMEQSRLRQIQGQANMQAMGINAEKEKRAQEEQQAKMLAPYAKAILESEDPNATYQKIKPELAQLGLQPDKLPPEYSKDMAPILTSIVHRGGMEIAEKWEQTTSPAGAPAQVSTKTGKQIAAVTPDVSKELKNARKDMLYQGMIVPGIVFPNGVVVNADTGELMPGATYAPSTQETFARSDSFTKGAQTQLDKDAMTQLANRDAINNLVTTYNDFTTAGYEKNKITDLGSGVGNFIESWGGKLPEGWAEQNKSYDDLNVAMGRGMDAYRKIVTGGQASFQEIDKFVKNRVPNEGDAKTRFESKLKAVIEIDEISSIRLAKLKKDGWVYAGSVGKGDNKTAMVSKDGQKVPIEKAMSLDMIPRYEDRRNQIMTSLAKGRSRSEIPQEERRQMAQETMKMLNAEGYNTDARALITW